MARVTGEDPAAGLPDEMVPPEDVDLGALRPLAAGAAHRRADRARAARGGGGARDARHRELAGCLVGPGRGLGRPRQHPGLPRRLPHLVGVALGRAAGRERRADGARLLVHGRPRPRRPRAPGGGGAHGRRADAAAPRRAPGADVRGARRLRSRGGGGDPGHALLGDLRLRRLPQRHVPEGPARRGGGLAAPHPRRRRPARPRPRLAALRRRGAAHAPQRARRARGAPALALRLVLGAQDRREADGVGAARRGRRALGRGRQPLLRAGDVVAGGDPRPACRAGST